MLFLPDRSAHPSLPEGWVTIRVNGRKLSANFVKVALNVVKEPGSDKNLLPMFLTGWFGPDAGKSGTRHQVLLRREDTVWVLEPVGDSSKVPVA
jgi:hypothetical protein